MKAALRSSDFQPPVATVSHFNNASRPSAIRVSRIFPSGIRAAILAVSIAIASASISARASEPVDLLLVADEPSLQPLIGKLDHPSSETFGAWTIWLGGLAGKSVALARTEGDPLNAIAVTTLAVRHHSPKLIVTFGTARAHDPALHHGDLVVSDKFVPFDGMIAPHAEVGAGSNPLKWERLTHALMTAGETEKYVDSFPADPAAAAIASGLANAHGRVIRGTLGSAGQINREADRIAFLHAEWHTSTEDAESAFVAGCATLLGKPVVGLRIVDGSPADAAELAMQFVKEASQ